MSSAAFKTVSLKPLTSVMDVRSLPNDMKYGPIRYRLNWWMNQNARLARLPGWTRFLNETPYYNADLHDQLLPLQVYYDGGDVDSATSWPNALCDGTLKTRTAVREPLSLMFETLSTSGNRNLITGTQSRLYEFNYSNRNWRLLADGMGGPHRDDFTIRFRCAQVKDTVVFTNNYDKPQKYLLDTEAKGCAVRVTSEITELNTIKLSRAKHIIAYKGYIILGDVVMDGRRMKGTMVWCASNRPEKWDPIDTALDCGSQELPGQEIRGWEHLGDGIVIYTDKEIWKCYTTGNKDAPLEFTRVYRSDDGKGCLFYENTLVSSGTTHYYLGKDGTYTFTPYVNEPSQEEWINKGDGLMFANINESCGGGTNAAYYAEFDAIFVWWAAYDAYMPEQCFIFQPKFNFTAYADFGATAACQFTVDDRPGFRDYMFSPGCACGDTDYKAMFVKEGYSGRTADCTAAPVHVWTDETMTIDGFVTENWLSENPSADSLCHILGTQNAEDLCASCAQSRKFIFAHYQDWCIKDFNNAYSREACVNTDDEGASLSGADMTIGTPKLDYSPLRNWNITAKCVDLLGDNGRGGVLWDVHPGNGLYLDLCGTYCHSSDLKATIQTKTFPWTDTHTYRLTTWLGGNARQNRVGDQVRVRMTGDAGDVVDVTYNIPWNDDFTARIVTFAAVAADVEGEVVISQHATGGTGYSLGCCLKRVLLEDTTTNETLLDDNFNTENGGSQAELGLPIYTTFSGQYSQGAYLTKMLLGPMDFGDPVNNKMCTYMKVHADAALSTATDPVYIGMKIGLHFNPVDPLSETCDVIWVAPENRLFKCWMTMTGAQYVQSHLLPAYGIEAPFYVLGRYLYVDLRIGMAEDTEDPNSEVIDGIGGEGAVSCIDLQVRKVPG